MSINFIFNNLIKPLEGFAPSTSTLPMSRNTTMLQRHKIIKIKFHLKRKINERGGNFSPIPRTNKPVGLAFKPKPALACRSARNQTFEPSDSLRDRMSYVQISAFLSPARLTRLRYPLANSETVLIHLKNFSFFQSKCIIHCLFIITFNEFPCICINIYNQIN